MPLFLKALDPDIDVFGNRQSFHFNHEETPDDNKGFYSLVNHFTPTANTKLESSLDLLDKNLNGFRLFHEKPLNQTYGSLALQSHSVFGTSEDIFKYDEATDKLTFYKNVEFDGGGVGTVTSVGITGSTGINVSGSPITSSGTIGLSLSSNLQNLASQSSSGIMSRSSGGSYLGRTITAGSGISVSNGNGISGNPTISTSNIPISSLSGYPSSSSRFLRGDGVWSDPIALPQALYTSSTTDGITIYNSNNSAYGTGFRVVKQSAGYGVEFGFNNSTSEGYVWAESAMSLKFGTNGTTRMKINSDGSVNMYANRITNLAYPSGSSDAATKSYVDSVAGGGGSGSTSILHGYVSSSYSSDVSSGDHLKFSAISFSRGSSISLDTSSSYTRSTGYASIGRITLQAGKTYKLVGSINNIGSTSYNATRWYNSDNNTPIGLNSGSAAPNSSIDRVPSATTVGYITTSTTTRVELRSTWNSFSQVRGTNDAIGPAWFTVEEV